jgi:hypothetical protein
MLGNKHFYNRTIRKIIVSFGTIFNDIELYRYNKDGSEEFERIKVPLSFATKEKFITRIKSDPTLTKSIAISLPRMSFEMTGMSYDSNRKQNTLNKNFSKSPTTHKLNTQYSPVPYNFDFSLSIYTRNMEDGTQILEQILPFFTPDFTVTVNLVPNMTQKYDLPVILNTVNQDFDYEGDLLTTRTLIWTLTFTVKAYIFPPVDLSGNNIIRQANSNILITDYKNVNQAQKVYVDMSTGNGVFVTGETIRVESKDISGTILYFSNNSTGTLIVEDLNQRLLEQYVIRGDYSNARYIIDTVDYSPLKSMVITTLPNPIDANPDDDYGFTEIITEYPYTEI